jgi:Flp pilus assembly protein TadG
MARTGSTLTTLTTQTPWQPPPTRSARGSVTAETAVLLPTLVVVAATLMWLVSVGVAQVRCVDAARDAARALARDEPTGVAVDLARQVAPDGAQVQVRRVGDLVDVEVTYRATPPGAVLDPVAALDLRATATTPAEVSGGTAW